MISICGLVQFGCPGNFFHPIISKLDKHVVLLLINYTVKISLHVMTFLPFKVFFLKHRKPSAFVTLVSVAKIQRKIWQFLRKLWRCLKMDCIARCDCRVMSRHGARCAYFALIGWFTIFSNFIGWRQTIQVFLNLDTCVVSIVKVSNKTIQLIIIHHDMTHICYHSSLIYPP